MNWATTKIEQQFYFELIFQYFIVKMYMGPSLEKDLNWATIENCSTIDLQNWATTICECKVL